MTKSCLVLCYTRRPYQGDHSFVYYDATGNIVFDKRFTYYIPDIKPFKTIKEAKIFIAKMLDKLPEQDYIYRKDDSASSEYFVIQFEIIPAKEAIRDMELCI